MLDKNEIMEELSDKVCVKLNHILEEIIESYSTRLDEEMFYVYDTTAKDISAGPFSNRNKAQQTLGDNAGGNLVVMGEKELEKTVRK